MVILLGRKFERQIKVARRKAKVVRVFLEARRQQHVQLLLLVPLCAVEALGGGIPPAATPPL